jgi:tetratricopeptide (TPR) repeat protein
LIFSNACYSATEDKPGLPDCDYQKKSYSIAAAFLFSGVRHYIGAIRKVEDSASLFFAKEFYHSLISGESVGKSLRLGRIKLIKEYGITSMHWANYLLYGDPAFSMFKIKHKALPARNKYILKWLKRWSVFLTAITVLVLISGFLYFWLPTVNPSSYYLYLKSKKLFNRGENIEVINIGNKLIKADPDFPNMYILLANAYYRLGDKENALKNYFDYALLSEKRGDFNQLAGSYAEIGWFYQLEGEYTKAYDFYNRAIEIARKNKDKLNEAVALRKLAVWHIDRKEYDAALSLLTKSSEINRERQSVYAHRYNLACDYFDIGLLFANQNDFATAEEFYKKSKIIFEKLSLKYELSDYYFNLGELYVFEKQFNKALSAYLAGLKIDQVQGNRVNLASDYNMIGELYIEMDRLIDAQLALEQSVTISRQLNSRSDLALAYRNLGLLFKKQGKKSKAKEYLRLAQEIYGQIDPIAYKEVKSEILGFDEPKSADLTNK